VPPSQKGKKSSLLSSKIDLSNLSLGEGIRDIVSIHGGTTVDDGNTTVEWDGADIFAASASSVDR
jgi:hypothetical protein